MDAMTQYRVEEPRALSRSEDEQAGQPRVIASGDLLRGRLGRSQGDQELKLTEPLSMHDILQGMQDLRDGPQL